MQKEETFSWIAFLLCVGFTLGMGFGFIQPALKTVFQYQSSVVRFFVIIIPIVIGFLLHAILLELGHVLGALMGGYKVLSCNILRFSFFKVKDENGNIYTKFKFPKNYDGLTGQTVVQPKREDAKPTLSIFMPIFLLLVEVLATVLVFWYVKDSTATETMGMMYFKYGLLTSTSIGGALMIYDYFPAKLEWLNDGYRLVMLNKKTNIVAYNRTLEAKARRYFGESTDDIELFEEINDLTGELALFRAKELVTKDYLKSIEIIDRYTAEPDKISKKLCGNLRILKAYALFMNEDLETAKNYYINELNEDDRKMVVNFTSPLALGVYILYESLVEKSSSEVEIATSKIKKILGRTSFEEKEEQQALLNSVLDKLEIKLNK